MSQWPSTKAVVYYQHYCVLVGASSVMIKLHTESFLNQDGQIIFLHFTIGKRIGRRMLARIAKHTGLTPDDL